MKRFPFLMAAAGIASLASFSSCTRQSPRQESPSPRQESQSPLTPQQTPSVAPAAKPVPVAAAGGELANLKIVTDASPDYTDMESMTRSITSNWSSDAEKMWALFYWDHIARRQTNPMMLHGFALADPIRQFNDYGYTMCSTISGIKCSTWNYMGYPCRYFDISNHTVCDVWYDGRFHHYDNSLSMYYTLPDGKTVASVEDVGKTLAGPETGGKPVKGYIALYHAVTGTGPDGYCEGADTERPLKQIVGDFNPGGLKYRYYLYDQDRGHRYTLNLRDGEVYTRFYSRQDAKSQNAVAQSDKSSYKADPAYFVPNGGKDPETSNPRYKIRGNGERTWTPVLDAAHLAGELHSSTNIKAGNGGLVAEDSSKPAVAIFKVEGANVITSLKIHADATGSSSIAVSTTNGLQWNEVMKSSEKPADLKLIDEVNGSYEVLVKVTLEPGASLKSIAFDTITEVNAHTQPQLKLGKNTVYVGNGEQTESIVLWPQLHNGGYKPYVVEEVNIGNAKKNPGYMGSIYYDEGGKEGYVVFKIDSPTDLTSVTYGGRFYNRANKAHIDLLHSFDGGQTWTKDYSLTDTKSPWDVVHYETVTGIPTGTKSVLFKYSLNGPGGEGGKGGTSMCSIYAVRMEANHKLAQQSNEPVEVTFNWRERQQDYSTVQRSHTQVVDKLPATYTIDVGGFDQPIVESLTVNLKGSRPDVKAGYSDGKDVGGEKFVGKWATYGKNLAMGKSYTVSVPPVSKEQAWGANDDSGKRLTDGRVGSSYTGGVNFGEGPAWKNGANPEITVDLGQTQSIGAFRFHALGYPAADAMKGEFKDKVEVLVSQDGKEYKPAGNFDFRLYWKDIPVNYMWNDEESFNAHNHTLTLSSPVEARYVKFKVANVRTLVITEVQALDKVEYKPFDLKIALPNPADNGKPAPKADVSPNARKWSDNEKLPKSIGKQFKGEVGSGESPIPGATAEDESGE